MTGWMIAVWLWAGVCADPAPKWQIEHSFPRYLVAQWIVMLAWPITPVLRRHVS